MESAIEKASVAVKNNMVQITSIDDGYRFAALVHQSGLAPESFQTPQAIMIAVQMGAELGLTPMMSLKTITVIKGRPAIGGKDMPSIVLRSGLLEKFEESYEGSDDDYKAICRVKRKGLDGERVGTFSKADAKRAGLWGTGTWSRYPKDMLMYKARARAFQLFSDVLVGLPVAEDIQEVPGEEETLKKKARRDPLLKKANACVIESTPKEPEVSDPPPHTETNGEAAAEAPQGDEDESLLPPDESESPSAAVPENADLIAALEDLSSNTAGLGLKDLQGRVEKVFTLMKDHKPLWIKARNRSGARTNKALKDMDDVGLRKLLCECADVVKA